MAWWKLNNWQRTRLNKCSFFGWLNTSIQGRTHFHMQANGLIAQPYYKSNILCYSWPTGTTNRRSFSGTFSLVHVNFHPVQDQVWDRIMMEKVLLWMVIIPRYKHILIKFNIISGVYLLTYLYKTSSFNNQHKFLVCGEEVTVKSRTQPRHLKEQRK